MPQDLAALLVEEGAVSQADMERAAALQAREGGALDTALLELELVGEGHLRSFLSHASGLPAVPPGALAEIDQRARRVFPAKVAERHRLAPFALDGRELSVVAVHPLDAAAIDEIGFMLSLTLVPHVGPEWRVHDLIQRLYGGQMPARLARLAEREQRRDPAAPQAAPAPPPPQTPRTQSVEDAFFAAGEAGAYAAPASAPGSPPHPALSPGGGEGVPLEQPSLASTAPALEPALPAAAAADEASFAGLDDSDTAIVAPAPLPPEAELEPEKPPAEETAGEPPAARADETSFAEIEPEREGPSGFGRDESEPSEPLLAALELAVDAYDALWADAAPEPSAQLPAEAAPAAAPAPVTEEPPAEEPETATDAEVEPEAEEAEAPDLPPAQLDRSAPPRWSIEEALTALASAVHRDEVVLTALRYARDFFEFSALLAVTRDAVMGHDALGTQEEARLHARATAIYAEDPGIVRTVLETRAPYLGPAARDAPGTANILDGLWRGAPHTVLLYPILVGDRPVAVLYADNGEAPVAARRLGDLLLFLSTVGGRFERIIRARKKRGPGLAKRPAALVAPPPPPAEDAFPSEPQPSWMAPPPEVGAPPEPSPEPSPEPAEAPGHEAEAEPGAVEGEREGGEALEAAGSGEVSEPPPAEGQSEGADEVEPPPRSAAPAGASPGPELPPHPALSPGGGEGRDPGGDDGRLEAAIALLLAGGQGPPDRVAPIVDLLLDPEPEVSAAAREALAELRAHAGVKPVPERLRRGLLSGIGERPVLAALALGALRDIESIPILIQAFEGGSPEGAEAAAEALTRITLQRYGPSAQRWLRWWKENRGRSRAEWLFAALTADDRDLRVAASEELRAAAETPIRYSPDLPSAELEAAARSWWVWWSRQGVRV